MQEDQPRRRRQRTPSECYCKMKETNDESSLPSSQRLSHKSSENKREGMSERALAIDLDIELPDKRKFETKILESPTLSPDTQNAIENAEKIVEEALCKIVEVTKISTTGLSRGIRKELYTDDLKPPLEDEIGENLYIRELVSSKLNKINNGISEDSEISTDRSKIVKNKIIKKRNVDLLAPKFRTMERRFSGISCQPVNHRYKSSGQVQFENSKFMNSNKKNSDDLPVKTKIHKTKSLTIQKGPSLNIERELKKQDLGFVHISPDASFVQDKTNINFYSFSHESCKKRDILSKNIINEQDEKLIDNVAADVIDRHDQSTIKNQVIKEKSEIFEEKSIAEDDIATFTAVVEKKDNVSFEGSINSERIKKDRENVSEHLPRTGVDYFTLNEEEPNSYCSNDVKKNEENSHYERRKIVRKICSNDGGTDVQNSLIQNERNDGVRFIGDYKNVDCHEKRTNDEVPEVDDDIEKSRKKKMADRINYLKNIKTTHERDLNKEFHNVVDKRFSDICEKYDASSKISNKTSQFNARKESTDFSDISLQETDFIFNEIELSPPSIETFDNILYTYDNIIDRVSKNEKKIDETLMRLQATLSNEGWEPVISNTKVKSYDLVPLTKNDTRSMKLNCSNDSHNVNNSDSMLSLSDESQSIIVEQGEDKLVINECTKNDVLKEGNASFLHKKCDPKKESRSIKKHNRKMNDILTLDESPRTITHIPEENKTLELKGKMTVFLSDEKLENLESHKNDTHLQTLFLRNEEQREKKFEYERAIVNNLSGMTHTSSMLEEILKHLQTFSNAHTENIPTVFKNVIMDITKRESGVILDFLSIQKQDDGNTYTSRLQTGSSLQAIAQNGQCKIQEDVIIGTHVLQEPSRSNDIIYNSDRTVECKEKSLEICPLDLIEIKPTKHLVNELSQTEIEVLEKGTQYEVLYERNAHESDDKIIEDICTDKNGVEDIAEKKNEANEYPTRGIQMNDPEIAKLNFIINDDSEKNNTISETNRIDTDSVKNAIMEDLYFNQNLSDKILHKLSDSEDYSFRTNISNIKRVNANNGHFTTTSTETSHSEGELYLPSSCSYSLGEVRVIQNSASMCNHALVSTSTMTGLGETASLLRHSSGEIYAGSSDTL